MAARPDRLDSPWPPMHETPGAFPATPNYETDFGIASAPQSLSQAVKARKSDYVGKRTIKIKVGSWNVAAIKGTEKDLGPWFVEGLGVKGLSEDLAGLSLESSSHDALNESNIESVEDQEQRQRKKKATVPKNDVPALPHGDEIELYVLGLQEIVDITSATEALRQYTDTHATKKWKQTMEEALPPGYQKVAEQQLLGLLLLVYASPKLAPAVSSVSTTSVGTGLLGYMGNKGAACARIVLGETTRLVFINCHLAAGNDKAALERRNWDAEQILSRTRFSPVMEGEEVSEEYSEEIGDEDFTFWFGDLNYRLEDMPGSDVRRLLMLHTRNEYDVNNKSKRKIDSELGFIDVPSSETSSVHNDGSQQDSPLLDPMSDPASLHTTLQSLLPHDQLRTQQKIRRAFHQGWREGEINFLPTYKYDVGSVGMFDSGEKKRGPSWCDRILYRSHRDISDDNDRLSNEMEAKKKDADMKSRGIDQAASEDDILFEYNPDTDGLAFEDGYDEDGDAAQDATLLQTQESFENPILLDHYVSHQRILSSDHKPLDAVFTLTYDSVIPELKARVSQEVARELDKAENEGRPGLTVVVDHHSDESIATADPSAEQSDMSGVDFGEIRYDVPKTRGLTVANTGRVPATFHFLDRPVSEGQTGSISPAWLKILVFKEFDVIKVAADTTREYTLSPGETANIKLIVEVTDLELVYSLNERSAKIDDVLVLRINEGRDHFLPVHGTWMPSSFCRSLDDLTSLPEGGVRAFHKAGEKEKKGPSQSQDGSNRLSAPRELFDLTEAIQHLVERSLAEWEMTNEGREPPWRGSELSAGWPFESKTWTLPPGAERSRISAAAREALDTSTTFADHFPPETPSLPRLEVLAETLILFLQSLRDGIVPEQLWLEMESQMSTHDKTKARLTDEEFQAWVLEMMSSTPVHSVAFTFLTFMLVRIADEVAPLSATTTSTHRSPRRSTASSRSEESEIDRAVSPSEYASSRASVFPTFRRRNRASTSVSSADDSSSPSPSLTRRREVQHAFSSIFAKAMIRTGGPRVPREKERKLLKERQRRVLQAFLSSSA